MRPLIVLPVVFALAIVACATPTAINVSVGSEVQCDAGATVVVVGGASLGALASKAPSAVSSLCASGANEAEMGNVVLVPATSKNEAVAFAVMTRDDGQPPDGCLDPAQASHCIVAKRELRFLPRTELSMRIDLRLSCLGVECPSGETCVKGVCLGAQVPAGSCTGSCDEGSLVAADGGARYPIGGTLTGLAPGDTAVVQDNGSDNLALTANGAFVFATPLATDDPYAVTIQSSPTSPTPQTCAVVSGSGIAGAASAAAVQVRCANNGTVAVASGQDGADHVAVDAVNVYWTNYNGGTVMKAPVGGGAATTLASGQHYTLAIAVDATSVFWTNTNNPGGSVVKALIDGSMTTTLATAQGGPAGITANATGVYWTTQGGGTVVTVPLGTGTPTTLASSQGLPFDVAVDGTSVYWTTSLEGRVKKVPLGGGATVTLATGQTQVQSIAVDATSVYWANQITPGAVVKMPLAGGVPTTLAAGQTSPAAIAVDATSVYWANADGTIMSVPLGGGAATTVVTGQNDILSITVDATSLYWAAYGAGTVMRLTPK